MLTIFGGNNTSEARKKLIEYRETLIAENYEVYDLHTDVKELPKKIEETSSLFTTKRAFFIENVLSKKVNRDVLKEIKTDNQTQIVIWDESIAARDIKKYFAKAKIISVDLPETIWKLLDIIASGKKIQTINILKKLADSVDEQMILYMVQRRAKELILAKKNMLDPKLQSWQRSKLQQQALSWNEETLFQFYDKLFDIEKGVKTSKLIYSITQALEVVFCFYL
ncbi:hypothetical protein A3D06_00755 [Candidatus Roizmanbacteria bacterium RIFCSPHIGHO2_02_FULL_40_9]|uniref:DNA polymerase III delta N-terminal domain-containing protein n=2 Tax=Candidatus Roizmaniibacteriota TaxID=1752723 RepID=A0A1F7IKE1_9BACT|nr:MAG: hypothetical protein A3D06_00755 [Candidatus Roizmanbacteria bacterium RIFCSPHIGHO2_02_FULL_40_9]OGK43820.1 MAG: hypothetical protein A2957_02505 [Candidatus Roizmanbacteria bacterium RIFCSPLOWO2_01_FULL_38_11]